MPYQLFYGLDPKYRLPLCCFLSVVLQSSSNTEPAQHLSLGRIASLYVPSPHSQPGKWFWWWGSPSLFFILLGLEYLCIGMGHVTIHQTPGLILCHLPSLELLECPQKSPTSVDLCTELSGIQLGCHLVSPRVFPGSMKFWKGPQEKCKIETGLTLDYLKTI